MNLRSLLTFSLLFSSTFANYQKVTIGTIDSHYKNSISKKQLISIIKEIRAQFNRQLGMNLFDYSADGKPINILYVPPSKTKRSIDQGVKELKKIEKNVLDLQEYLASKQIYIESTKKRLQKENKDLNKHIKNYNSYIKKTNKRKVSTQDEYNKLINEANKKKKHLAVLKDKFNQKQIKFKSFLYGYNQKVSLYNSMVRQYTRLARKIEVMARGSKEVRGAAIGYIETTFKTFYKDGKVHKEKSTKSTMDKIEIYGFDSLDELKAVLAHEIAHLLGVGHVNAKGALMNPTLQKNQIQKLKLTPADIKAFRTIQKKR